MKRGIRVLAKECGNGSSLGISIALILCIVGGVAIGASSYYTPDAAVGATRTLAEAGNGTTGGGTHGCGNYAKEEGAGFFILWLIVCLYFFLGLAIICDDFFVSSLERISERLNLSEDVAGATFMAAGSSAPELFTSVMDTFVFTNNVGIGTIVGSAVFNILVIIALSAAVSTEDLLIDWRPFVRDCVFYTVSIALTFIFVMNGEFNWWNSLILVLWYVVYVLFMTQNQTILSKCGNGAKDDEDERTGKTSKGVEMADVDVNVATKDTDSGDTKDPESGDPEEKPRRQVIPHRMTVTEIPGVEEEEEPQNMMEKFVDVCSMPWGFIFKYTIPDAGESSEYKKYYVITFIMSVVWIGVLSYVLCDMVARMGCMLNVPAPIMGLTVLAAGTSIPDALGSMVASKEGMGDMAVSNAIGSNVFDICLGLGIPYLIKTGIVHGGTQSILVSATNKDDMVPSIIVLAVTLAGTAGIMVVNKWRLTKNVGRALFFLYLCFFTYNVVLGAIRATA